jgi:hypothetical protein
MCDQFEVFKGYNFLENLFKFLQNTIFTKANCDFKNKLIFIFIFKITLNSMIFLFFVLKFVKQQKHTCLIEGVHFHSISNDVPKKVKLIEKNEF